MAQTSRKHQGAARRDRVWVRTIALADIDRLRTLLTEHGERWSVFEYKLHRGNLLIHKPVIPFNRRTGRSDPALRYMTPHLRIVPSAPGPFTLQYMRYTGQWCSIAPAAGSIEDMARFITVEFCYLCEPYEYGDVEAQ